MIHCSGLSKSFGPIPALVEVNLQLDKGSITGLLGPDGAGKTTLLRMICGLITADSGQVKLLGLSPEKIDPRDLGYMPQRFSLYGDLSVIENINFFASLYGLPKTLIRKRAGEILERTGLAGFEQRLAEQLSGGMKQKLALSCALITRPQILVLDEPTYGVDPASRQEFWHILYDLNSEGMTILLSTPYMDEAELCHQVAFINQGRLERVGTASAIIQSFPFHILEVKVPVKDPGFFDALPGILDASFYGYKYRLVVEEVEKSRRLLEEFLSSQDLVAESIAESTPSMEELFVFLAESPISEGCKQGQG